MHTWLMVVPPLPTGNRSCMVNSFGSEIWALVHSSGCTLISDPLQEKETTLRIASFNSFCALQSNHMHITTCTSDIVFQSTFPVHMLACSTQIMHAPVYLIQKLLRITVLLFDAFASYNLDFFFFCELQPPKKHFNPSLNPQADVHWNNGQHRLPMFFL